MIDGRRHFRARCRLGGRYTGPGSRLRSRLAASEFVEAYQPDQDFDRRRAENLKPHWQPTVTGNSHGQLDGHGLGLGCADSEFCRRVRLSASTDQARTPSSPAATPRLPGPGLATEPEPEGRMSPRLGIVRLVPPGPRKRRCSRPGPARAPPGSAGSAGELRGRGRRRARPRGLGGVAPAARGPHWQPVCGGRDDRDGRRPGGPAGLARPVSRRNRRCVCATPQARTVPGAETVASSGRVPGPLPGIRRTRRVAPPEPAAPVTVRSAPTVTDQSARRPSPQPGVTWARTRAIRIQRSSELHPSRGSGA